MALLPGGDVTHALPDGRLVAVLEAGSARAVVQQIDGLRALRGVVDVVLVYQHAEPADEMRKELDP